MSAADPLGYYKVLGVAPHVSAAEIKAAFRRKAMEYHPDRCKLPNATRLFQQVNQAFSALGNPDSRARYDTSTVDSVHPSETSAHRAPPEPIRCSVCNKVSAQPRYVIFFRVFSCILVTRRDPVQGTYCSTCAEKVSLKASAFTWLLSWWGLPWGPFYGLQAIFTNLVGGKRPLEINARLLAHQAWYFAAIGQLEVARAVAEQALALALRVPPSERGAAALVRAQLDAFLASFPPSARAPQLKNPWVLGRRPFFLQLAAFATAIALVALLGMRANSGSATDLSSYTSPPLVATEPVYSPVSPPDSQSPSPSLDFSRQAFPVDDGTGQVASPPRLEATPVIRKPAYLRPVLAPNGRPWPATAGYLQGVPRENYDGYSEVTIDNAKNGSDVFVKLVARPPGAKAHTVRQFFVPAHGSFVLRKVRQGSYDVRYMDLETGGKSGTPSFDLTETPMPGGVEYTQYELTLYTVFNGNMQMRPLSDDEF